MSFFKSIGLIFLVFCIFSCFTVSADEKPSAPNERKLAIGFNVDLLPSIVSAINGKVGGAGQVWFGVDHVRLRLVAANLRLPDGFLEDGFTKNDVTVTAFIFDYVSGDNFDGFWIGTGLELWQNSIQNKNVAGTVYWTSGVFTVGGGYIWKFYGNFYIDPWVGVHFIMNNRKIELGDKEFTPMPVTAEGSLKIGWNFDL